MKKFVFTFIILCLFFSIKCQNINHYVYLTQEQQFGNYFGGNLNVNYIYNEKYSAQIGTSFLLRKAHDLPSNYSSGLIKCLISRIGSTKG